MTLNDIKNASGYSEIVNYRKTVSSLTDVLALQVYYENGKPYKDFYIFYHNQSTCLKVKMVITHVGDNYVVTSGYITLKASATDMLIEVTKTCNMIPTTGKDQAQLINDWNSAIYNDNQLKRGMLDIFGDDIEELPMWYSLSDEYLHVPTEYLDLIYNYLNATYGGNSNATDNIYKYDPISRNDGIYTISTHANPEILSLVLASKTKNGDISIVSGWTADDIYTMINLIISVDNPLVDMANACQCQRIAFRSISPTYMRIKYCGYDFLNNSITVNNGVMSGTTKKSVCIDLQMDNGEITIVDTATNVEQKNCTFTSTTRTDYLDAFGRSNSGLATEIYENVTDSIGFDASLKPYTPVGNTPTSTPRGTRYPSWVDTINDPDPTPDPTPTPINIVPLPPDVVVKPKPPITRPDPVPEDEECNVETSENNPPDCDGALGQIYDLGADNTKLDQLANTLYDPTSVERICQVWKNNPNESIISLHYMYLQPDVQAGGIIKLGNFNTNINADVVTNRYVTFNCGTRAIERKFNNAMDYQTKISLYLPFSSIHQLDTEEVMNSKITVKGTCDVISGDILYQIIVNRKDSNGTYMTDNKCLYTFTGNCKVDIPYSASSVNSGVAGGIGGVLSSIVSKNPIGAITGAVGTALGGVTNISHGGSLSGNTGAMGYKYPYLIIEYPKVVDVALRGKMFGYSANKTIKVSDASGYAEFDKVHVDTIACSKEDRDEIEKILSSGVIL